MRFADIKKGQGARRDVDLTLADGQVVRAAVRVLLPEDDDTIETQALAYAKERGVESPAPGDPIFRRGVALHTLLLACIDPESPDEAPAPFFDSVEQIESALDRDRIARLYAAQIAHQHRCSPRGLHIGSNEAVRELFEAATPEDERPFVRLRHGLQRTFKRRTASLPSTSRARRSATGWARATSSSGSASWRTTQAAS
jgi:hypothetical protein